MSLKLSGRFRLGAWLVDPAIDTISRHGESVKLEPRMMRLLVCLAESRGGVISQERLLSEVWAGVVVGPASVYQAISQLRRVLGDVNAESSYIATIPRKGYRLVEDVELLEAPPSAGPIPQQDPPAARPSSPGPVQGAASGIGRWRSQLTTWIWAVVMIAAAVLMLRSLQTSGLAHGYPQVSSIVVLPLMDYGADHGDQPFCDGLTEEIANWLAQIPNLKVAARSAAWRYRETGEDARSIGNALGATHVLMGSLRRSGDHVRIGIQLVDARTGYHVWSSEYDRALEDAIKIQEDIARSVADSLELKLSDQATQRLAGRRTDNPEAYRLYLLARHAQRSRTSEDNARAIDYYHRSLELDPAFALSYVGLAYATLNEISLDNRPVAAVQAEVQALLDKAERLEPQLSELYAVRAALREELGRTDDALADLKKAVHLNASDSWAMAELGRLYSAQGRPREALPALQQALALDPVDYVLYARECVVLQDLARFAQADAACERARALHGEGNWCAVASAWLAYSEGDVAKAIHWGRRALSSDPRDVAAYERVADYFLTVGESSAARATYDQARAATHDEARVQIGLAGVAFFERGPAGLKAQLASGGLERFTDARTLIDRAYLHLLLGESSTAMDLMHRAMAAPDFDASRLNSPWYARWGQSDLLILAAAELMSGRQQEGLSHLQQIAQLLDRLIDDGEERGGIYALQAQVLAMQGKNDEAMGALARAVDLGWRAAWLAEHEPYLASLSARSDFQLLVARVEQANRRSRAQLQSEL